MLHLSYTQEPALFLISNRIQTTAIVVELNHDDECGGNQKDLCDYFYERSLVALCALERDFSLIETLILFIRCFAKIFHVIDLIRNN